MSSPPWITKRKKAGTNWSGITFYQSKQWRRLRTEHLTRQPLCVMCEHEGKLTDCTRKYIGVVDHIIPIMKGGKALDPNNLQTLCKEHHRVKTLKENINDEYRLA